MFNKDSLHHAYFIEGERVSTLADIEVFLNDSFGIIRQGNPDVHYAEYESFGIDDGRAIQEMQTVKPIAGDRKIFIIATNLITGEAQNSLLKVFEEPTVGTHFFIISSSSRILLPTLRSRVVIVTHPSSKNIDSNDDAKKFISVSTKDRFTYVAEMIEEKNRAKAEVFLALLIKELRGKGPGVGLSAKKVYAIKEIISLMQYLKDHASSVKLILERVCLIDFIN